MLAVFLMRLAPEWTRLRRMQLTHIRLGSELHRKNIVVPTQHVHSGRNGRHSAKWTASLRSWTFALAQSRSKEKGGTWPQRAEHKTQSNRSQTQSILIPACSVLIQPAEIPRSKRCRRDRTSEHRGAIETCSLKGSWSYKRTSEEPYIHPHDMQ